MVKLVSFQERFEAMGNVCLLSPEPTLMRKAIPLKPETPCVLFMATPANLVVGGQRYYAAQVGRLEKLLPCRPQLKLKTAGHKITGYVNSLLDKTAPGANSLQFTFPADMEQTP